MSGKPEMVKASALARVLQVRGAELERMVDEDGLPALELPRVKNRRLRFFLPDVHRWMLIGARNSPVRLREYENFMALFARSGPRSLGEDEKRVPSAE